MGIELPLDQLKTGYLGKANNALIAALKDLYKQYESLTKMNHCFEIRAPVKRAHFLTVIYGFLFKWPCRQHVV